MLDLILMRLFSRILPPDSLSKDIHPGPFKLHVRGSIIREALL